VRCCLLVLLPLAGPLPADSPLSPPEPTPLNPTPFHSDFLPSPWASLSHVALSSAQETPSLWFFRSESIIARLSRQFILSEPSPTVTASASIASGCLWGCRYVGLPGGSRRWFCHMLRKSHHFDPRLRITPVDVELRDGQVHTEGAAESTPDHTRHSAAMRRNRRRTHAKALPKGPPTGRHRDIIWD